MVRSIFAQPQLCPDMPRQSRSRQGYDGTGALSQWRTLGTPGSFAYSRPLKCYSDYLLEILLKNDNMKDCHADSIACGETLNDQFDIEKSIRHRE